MVLALYGSTVSSYIKLHATRGRGDFVLRECPPVAVCLAARVNAGGGCVAINKAICHRADDRGGRVRVESEAKHSQAALVPVRQTSVRGAAAGAAGAVSGAPQVTLGQK